MSEPLIKGADFSSKTHRLLFVERDPREAETILAMLGDIKGVSLAVEHANTLDAGRAILADGNTDLALLDLPLRTGQDFEMLAKVIAEAPRVPILVMNDSDDESLYLRALEAGAQDYLWKSRLCRSSLIRAIVHAIKGLQSSDALFRERDLLRTVIDNLPDLIYVKDVESRYVLNNLHHVRFLGAKSREEVVGKSVRDYFPTEMAEGFYADEQAVVHSGRSIITKEESTVSSSGERIWVSTTKVPFRDSTGKIVGLVGLSRDITERVLAEEKVEQYAKDLAERNAEMEADLKLATEFQQAVLPREYPRFPCNVTPEESALRFFARYQPCSSISGDFFDVRALSDTTAAVFICDVMGHNVRAALVTAILDGLIEKMGSIAGNAGRFLTQINRDLAVILRRAEKLVFGSAFYMVVDAAAGRMSYANAGSPPPFLLKPALSEAVLVGKPSDEPLPALGLLEDVRYPTRQVSLRPGDAIVTFTDGLYEAENPQGEEFGIERLTETFRKHARESLPQTLDSVLEDLQRFCGKETFPDDICVLGLEVRRLIPSSASATI